MTDHPLRKQFDKLPPEPAEIAEPRITVATAARHALEALERWRESSPLECDALESFDQAAGEALAFLRRVLEADEGVHVRSLSPAELAERWGVSASNVRRLVESGELVAFNAAQGTVARWRIPIASAVRFVLERGNRREDPVFSAAANRAAGD